MFCIADLKKNINNISFCSFSLFSSNKVLGMNNLNNGNNINPNVNNGNYINFNLNNGNNLNPNVNNVNYINFFNLNNGNNINPNVNNVNYIINHNDYISDTINAANKEIKKIFWNLDFNRLSAEDINSILINLAYLLNKHYNNNKNKMYASVNRFALPFILKDENMNNFFKLTIGKIIQRNIITMVDINLKDSNNKKDNKNGNIDDKKDNKNGNIDDKKDNKNGNIDDKNDNKNDNIDDFNNRKEMVLNSTLYDFYRIHLRGYLNNNLFDEKKIISILQKTVNDIKIFNKDKIKKRLDDHKINKNTDDSKFLGKKVEREKKEKKFRGRKLITDENLNIPQKFIITDDFIPRCITDRNQLLFDNYIMNILSRNITGDEDNYILFLKSIIIKKYFNCVIKKFNDILKKIDEDLLKRLKFELSNVSFSTVDFNYLFVTDIEFFFRFYINTKFNDNRANIHTILNNSPKKYKDINKFFSIKNYDFYKNVFLNKDELINLCENLNNTKKPLNLKRYFDINDDKNKVDIIILATYLNHFAFQENILSSNYFIERVMYPKISKELIISNNSAFSTFPKFDKKIYPNLSNNNNNDNNINTLSAFSFNNNMNAFSILPEFDKKIYPNLSNNNNISALSAFSVNNNNINTFSAFYNMNNCEDYRDCLIEVDGVKYRKVIIPGDGNCLLNCCINKFQEKDFGFYYINENAIATKQLENAANDLRSKLKKKFNDLKSTNKKLKQMVEKDLTILEDELSKNYAFLSTDALRIISNYYNREILLRIYQIETISNKAYIQYKKFTPDCEEINIEEKDFNNPDSWKISYSVSLKGDKPLSNGHYAILEKQN